MNPEEIKALIADSIASALSAHSKALLDDVTAYVENREQSMEARIASLTPTAPEVTKDDESPLTARMALLEKELLAAKAEKEQQQAESRKLKFEASVAQSIQAQGKLVHSDVLTELMVKRLSDGFSEKDGTYVTKSGKTVDEEVKGFMGTEAGKHFMAPQQQRAGSGNPAPSVTPTRADNARSLANALLRR